MKKLYRNEQKGVVGGVCAGLGDYFEIDVTLIRVLFLITLFYGTGIIPYLILWFAIPERSRYI